MQIQTHAYAHKAQKYLHLTEDVFVRLEKYKKMVNAFAHKDQLHNRMGNAHAQQIHNKFAQMDFILIADHVNVQLIWLQMVIFVNAKLIQE